MKLTSRLVLSASLILATALPSHGRHVGTPAYKSVLIKNVPHVRQKPDFCGEACAEMYLGKLGHKTTQDDVFNASGLDPLEARGCYTKELAAALRAIGFSTGDVWHRVPAGSDEAMRAEWRALHSDLVAGVPSIVCMRTSNTSSATEHFRLVLGYDAKKEKVIYHEPAEAMGAYKQMPLSTFTSCWPLRYGRKEWTVIRLRLKPAAIKPPAAQQGYSDAQFAQHMMELKKKLPGKAFTVAIQKPFVVIGDESPRVVRARAERTVQWAAERLKKQYFTKDPDDIIDIWLFKDKASYRKHTWSIFKDRPDTPFGYSSPEHKALIMNIATGGGTLVHEIVHPFVAANFPECPAWLNEGLGSLYEQSTSRDGKIVGLTNWRLEGLQKAIKGRRVPSFKALTRTSDHEFYDEDPGTNYGQARYLCYYLQEKGLLEKFYHDFHASRKKDPTGYNTLQKVLGEKDMDEFKARWEKYVLGLHFP